LTGTPAVATVVLGLMAAFAALIIQLEVLVEMMSIGELNFEECTMSFTHNIFYCLAY
jgi:hypothetical protein